MKYLYRFSEHCGRMGILDGIFVADEEDIEEIIGKTVYFGEVLGKHSDISVYMTKENFEKIEISESSMLEVTKLLGNTWSGFNPIEMKDGF